MYSRVVTSELSNVWHFGDEVGIGYPRGMAALFGYIGEFVEGREQRPQYVERLKHFLAANGITGADREIFSWQ